MQMIEDDRIKSLFDQYNQLVAEACERTISSAKTEAELNHPDFQLKITQAMQEAAGQWVGLSATRSAGPERIRTIGEYLAGQNDPDLLANLIYTAALLCDDNIPEPLVRRVGQLGWSCIGQILDFCLQTDWEPTEDAVFADRFIATCRMIEALGRIRSVDCLQPLLDRFCLLDRPAEMLSDALSACLLAQGEQAIPALVNRINLRILMDTEAGNEPILNGGHEDLLVVLTRLGRRNRRPEIFDCLKLSFRKMSNKVIGAICLGDYGDPRGIATLRGWLEQHPDRTDRTLFYELLSSIKRLGGSADDFTDQRQPDEIG